jgi:hypothetical protein
LAKLLVVDVDDLFQSGVMGLILAVDHFDCRFSAAQTSFTRRIRRAIYDFLRSFPYIQWNGNSVERADESEPRISAQSLHGIRPRGAPHRFRASASPSAIAAERGDLGDGARNPAELDCPPFGGDKSSKCRGFVGYGEAHPGNVSLLIRAMEPRPLTDLNSRSASSKSLRS